MQLALKTIECCDGKISSRSGGLLTYRGEGLFRIRGISVVLFRGVSTALLLLLEQEDMDWQIWEVLLVAETPDSEG